MMASQESPGPRSQRRYDKGERRYKHVGKGRLPIFQFDSANPRKWVGKCPRTLTSEDHLQLLNEAIAGRRNSNRELTIPKKMYVVHEGAIYEAQTTNQGQSYHGYPYRGKLSRELLERLRELALTKDCADKFDDWVRKYIEVHGA